MFYFFFFFNKQYNIIELIAKINIYKTIIILNIQYDLIFDTSALVIQIEL